MLKDETVFITGGGGFIGYNICRMYLAHNVKQLIVYDNFSSGRREYITELASLYPNADINVVVGDILDRRNLFKYMEKFKPTIVNHHAAQLEITTCVKSPAYDINVNLNGTLNVLEAMVNCGCKRLINASSACVYGQRSVEQGPSLETDCPTPHWVYGLSKYSAEGLISIYCSDHDISAVSFRYSIVTGIGEWYGRVGTLFIQRCLDKQPLVIFGDGEQKRDIIDVSYAAEANLKCIPYIDDHPGQHAVFNVSSGRYITVKELAKTTLKAFEIPYIEGDTVLFEDVEEGKESDLVFKRVRIPNELKLMWLDNSKVKDQLGVAIPDKYDMVPYILSEASWISQHRYYWQAYHI